MDRVMTWPDLINGGQYLSNLVSVITMQCHGPALALTVGCCRLTASYAIAGGYSTLLTLKHGFH